MKTIKSAITKVRTSIVPNMNTQIKDRNILSVLKWNSSFKRNFESSTSLYDSLQKEWVTWIEQDWEELKSVLENKILDKI